VPQQSVLLYKLVRCHILTYIIHLPFVRSRKIPVLHMYKKILHCPSNILWPRQKFLSVQAEGNTDEQYNPPEEIDTDVQNTNLLLTSDHEYTDPFEIPSWGVMVVYLNTIMKWYGLTPQSDLYFDKSDLSPMRSPPGLYFSNPQKTTM
jgi:hypothetical protein